MGMLIGALVTVEGLRRAGRSSLPVAEVRTAVGGVAVQWAGAAGAAAGSYHAAGAAAGAYDVEWEVDAPLTWLGNVRPAEVPAAIGDGDHVILRGLLLREVDGASFLDLGGTLIQLDLTGGPDEDGLWVQSRVPRAQVALYPSDQ
ncbi:hypothetical protein [Dactylosporangium sp. NPDC000521]|uniref:hypothetical protein n=1 Tax=Dactylosporangium sp. NPDC000521 TaxID=3363975 RepID=UPI0036B44F99